MSTTMLEGKYQVAIVAILAAVLVSAGIAISRRRPRTIVVRDESPHTRDIPQVIFLIFGIILGGIIFLHFAMRLFGVR
jgi:hypothetical protein